MKKAKTLLAVSAIYLFFGLMNAGLTHGEQDEQGKANIKMLRDVAAVFAVSDQGLFEKISEYTDRKEKEMITYFNFGKSFDGELDGVFRRKDIRMLFDVSALLKSSNPDLSDKLFAYAYDQDQQSRRE